MEDTAIRNVSGGPKWTRNRKISLATPDSIEAFNTFSNVMEFFIFLFFFFFFFFLHLSFFLRLNLLLFEFDWAGRRKEKKKKRKKILKKNNINKKAILLIKKSRRWLQGSFKNSPRNGDTPYD